MQKEHLILAFWLASYPTKFLSLVYLGTNWTGEYGPFVLFRFVIRVLIVDKSVTWSILLGFSLCNLMYEMLINRKYFAPDRFRR